MVTTQQQNLHIVSLRSKTANDTAFESALRLAGHKVTVFSELEPVFSLIDFSQPDVVLFDPISKFGMSGAVQRLREKFPELIIALGHIPDPTIIRLLTHFGITNFAENPEQLLAQIKNVRGSEPVVTPEESIPEQPQATPQVTPEANLEPPPVMPSVPATPSVLAAAKPRSAPRKFSLPAFKWPAINRRHRQVVGAAVFAAVLVALVIPFLRQTPVAEQESVAKALPVVPRLLTEPMAPLTIEELSGDILPLEISGIKDRTVVEKPAIAFWGDTAPDAFLTVNGQPIEISEYGAFVVDFPLEDGANFIEVLVSDFQGRITRRSFTIVSLQ